MVSTHLKNMSVGMIIPNIWKNKIHVPNHQPDLISCYIHEISPEVLSLNPPSHLSPHPRIQSISAPWALEELQPCGGELLPPAERLAGLLDYRDHHLRCQWDAKQCGWNKHLWTLKWGIRINDLYIYSGIPVTENTLVLIGDIYIYIIIYTCVCAC